MEKGCIGKVNNMRVKGTLLIPGLHPKLSGRRMYFPKSVVNQALLEGRIVLINFDQNKSVGIIDRTFWEDERLKFEATIEPAQEDLVKTMCDLKICTAPLIKLQMNDRTQYTTARDVAILGVSFTAHPAPSYSNEFFEILKEEKNERCTIE